MNSKAPIALFVYRRPAHTASAIRALQANTLASESDLVVFSDGPKGPEHAKAVEDVRRICRSTGGFRSVTVVERACNFGLARNISEGVSEVCAIHPRVIVVEDDVVVGRHFLAFMNSALDRYEREASVWHISGWNYPMEAAGIRDAFFWRVMNCWGWATWHDRWRHFKREPEKLLSTWTAADIARFNVDSAYDFWSQVQANASGRIETWAVFWYATIFSHSGLCLNPTRSLVRNVGHDGSGENCGKASGDVDDGTLPDHDPSLHLPEDIRECESAIQWMKDHSRSTSQGGTRKWLRSFVGRLRGFRA